MPILSANIFQPVPLNPDSFIQILAILNTDLEPCERQEIINSLTILISNPDNEQERWVQFLIRPMNACKLCEHPRELHGYRDALRGEVGIHTWVAASVSIQKARIHLRRIYQGRGPVVSPNLPLNLPANQAHVISVLNILATDLEPAERQAIIDLLTLVACNPENLTESKVRAGIPSMGSCAECGFDMQNHGDRSHPLSHSLGMYKAPSNALRKARVYCRKIQVAKA